MSLRVTTPRRLRTLTGALCLAGAVTAGIALARPGSEPAAAVDPAAVTTTEVPRRGGFLDAPAPDAAASASLTIADFAFGTVSAAPGTTVVVINADGSPHTATGDGFDTGSIDGGDGGSFVAPGAPGTYEFFCAIHPSMRGQLTVTS
jgi:plastocyanin